MVKLHHYHQDKFSSFNEAAQIKALAGLLSALEANLTDNGYRQSMLPVILDCYSWSSPAVKKMFYALSELNPDTSAHEILQAIVPLIRLYDPKDANAETEVTRFDGLAKLANERMPYPLTVILDNLRSAYNVGSIFRTAECVQAAKLFLCGITPAPPHPGVLKTAMGTEEHLIWSYHTHTSEVIRQLQRYGTHVLALETTLNATSLFDYQLSQPVAVILGNEALGIDEEILRSVDAVLAIPTFGWKNSLNVSNAFAVAAYHLSGVSLLRG